MKKVFVNLKNLVIKMFSQDESIGLLSLEKVQYKQEYNVNFKEKESKLYNFLS